MGLIRAALSAATGNLADQWKEFFYCDSLDKETLVCQTVFGKSPGKPENGTPSILP